MSVMFLDEVWQFLLYWTLWHICKGFVRPARSKYRLRLLREITELGVSLRIFLRQNNKIQILPWVENWEILKRWQWIPLLGWPLGNLNHQRCKPKWRKMMMMKLCDWYSSRRSIPNVSTYFKPSAPNALTNSWVLSNVFVYGYKFSHISKDFS